MYDRAPRDFNSLAGSTAAHVGPGTYDPGLPSKARLKSDGYAPFLSMTSRDTFPSVHDTVVAAPGPGHYDNATTQPHIKGGFTVFPKEKRFKDFPSDTPGPGSYNYENMQDLSRKIASAPEFGMGKLVSSRVKFHRKAEAPSIPSKGLAYGYEECEDGSLRKQAPPNRDVSIGPAFYCPTYEDTKTTKQYKGVHFGKMTSQRMDFVTALGPPPGTYDPYKDVQTKAENANLQDQDRTVRMESSIPRYPELVVKEVEKRGVPGPGKYDIRGQFEPQQPKINTEGLEVEHPPFLSQAKRFAPIKNAVPAPGAYNDPRTALQTLNRVTGLKRSPFGQTSVRFQPEHNVKKTPGPGTYNSPGMGAESMKRAYLESTRKGVFGTTTSRYPGYPRKADVEQPGPGHYQVKEKPFQARYSQPTACFASVTSRLSEPPSTTKELPAPGFYNLHESFEKSQVKVGFAKPRTTVANRKHTSFLSASSRFTGPLKPAVDPDNPGPGAYNPLKSAGIKGGVVVSNDKRFKQSLAEDFPGPGAYELSPLMQDSVLKGTFNVTLNNPVALQMSPAHTTGGSSKHAFLLGV